MQNSETEGWRYLEERFGVTRQDLEDYQLRDRSGDLWLVSKGAETDLKIEVHGIRLIRNTGIGLKPTTYGLQILEPYISENIVEMSKEETLKMLRREEMIERELEETGCPEGYVALKFDGRVIGCGFYRNGKVSSRIPKARGEELAEILAV